MRQMVSTVKMWLYDPDENHDKVYDLEVWKDLNTEEYEVIGRWGRRGRKMSQQTKYSGSSESAANYTVSEIVDQKTRKGYDVVERT